MTSKELLLWSQVCKLTRRNQPALHGKFKKSEFYVRLHESEPDGLSVNISESNPEQGALRVSSEAKNLTLTSLDDPAPKRRQIPVLDDQMSPH
ncbi:hypothetical protein AVEN_192618-1 [Araneus ventricosus]|uniref:Uncharacterized protein n=1 Tax=Araneus ventricosus TaxID=182803 RepID=A0A4Y2UI48_ARAVE|nr:hypothetical protein AVEN_192618-1 [Araneus ventricosus]